MEVKFRNEDPYSETSEEGRHWYGSNIQKVYYPTTMSRKTQRVETQGNPYYLLGKVSDAIGGAFVNQKVTVLSDEKPAIHLCESKDHTTGYYAEGVPYASQEVLNALNTGIMGQTGLTTRAPTLLSDSDMDELGATAISRVIPTNPLVEGATAVAELFQNIPRIPGMQGGNIGSEYLNYVFGIKPTVSELDAIIHSKANADKILAQLRRDSGRLVRRRYEFPVTETESTSSTNGSYLRLGNNMPNTWLQSAGNLSVRELRQTKVWFEGAFTYHLPEMGTWERKVAEWDYLYGILPGISTGWNLTPWSWLVDWQSNIGDVAKNLDAFGKNGLVMPYGYVMVDQTVTRHYHLQNGCRVNGSWKVVHTFDKVEFKTSQRRVANPFGFGVTFDSLDASQIAILAALGISRK